MRYKVTPNARGMLVLVVWLLDAGVGIGFFGQGQFLLALLALVALPVAILVGLFLLSLAFALASALADWLAPLPRET